VHLGVDVERRLEPLPVERVVGQCNTVRVLARKRAVHEQRHADALVIDAAVAALLEGPERPDAGPDAAHGVEDALGIPGVAALRGIQAGAGEAVEVFRVGAGTKAQAHAGVVAPDPTHQQLGELGVDGFLQHLVAQRAQARVALRGVVLE
jgi:hypothetical protein